MSQISVSDRKNFFEYRDAEIHKNVLFSSKEDLAFYAEIFYPLHPSKVKFVLKDATNSKHDDKKAFLNKVYGVRNFFAFTEIYGMKEEFDFEMKFLTDREDILSEMNDLDRSRKPFDVLWVTQKINITVEEVENSYAKYLSNLRRFVMIEV